MGKFSFIRTEINDLYVIEPAIFADNRGYFMETYNYDDFKKAGLDRIYVQDNQSKSKKGVLRGLHFQKQYQQGKLVRVIDGEVFDVAVDLRKNSKTYGKWHGVFLSSDNKRQFYVPEGFAHGFLVCSNEAEFVYKCTNYYHPEHECSIAWNDPDIGIEWPVVNIDEIVLSEKDSKAISLRDSKIEL